MEKPLRRITDLYENGSSHRVLNLLRAHRLNNNLTKSDKEKLFQDHRLDHAIILKHRVRPHERDLFSRERTNATKILIPFDTTDLRSGAWSIFVGERKFEEAFQALTQSTLKPGTRDWDILEMMDALPSLDPFLLREKLRENGFVVAEWYFALSDSDLSRMFDYTRDQLSALASMSNGMDSSKKEYGRRLAEKILSPQPSEEMAVLRSALHMSHEEYSEGIFAWKGFLYYSWLLSEMPQQIIPVISEIDKIEPIKYSTEEMRSYISTAKARLTDMIMQALGNIDVLIHGYRDAYAALTESSDPNTFKSFLMSAPDTFVELGELVGRVQHVYSFWRYRVPRKKAPMISDIDLIDLFQDFDETLAFMSV